MTDTKPCYQPRPFPFVHRHAEAACFNCNSTNLQELSPTRNAPGQGHYRGYCKACNFYTWYDCAEGSVELIDLNEYRKKQTAK